MPGPAGKGPFFDPDIGSKACRNCGRPADLLGHNARLFPEDEVVDHPARYYPLCGPCSQLERNEEV